MYNIRVGGGALPPLHNAVRANDGSFLVLQEPKNQESAGGGSPSLSKRAGLRSMAKGDGKALLRWRFLRSLRASHYPIGA